MKTYTILGDIPSKKNMWHISRNGGMYQDKRVKDWMEAAGWELKNQKLPKYGAEMRLRAIFHMKRLKDLDNALATLFDCLQQNGFISNDSLIVEVEAIKKRVAVNPKTEFGLEII